MSIAFAPEVRRSFVTETAPGVDFDADAIFARDLAAAPEPQPIAAAPVEMAPWGWYPDPEGSQMLRWWNGTAWTDQLESPRPEVQPASGYSTQNLQVLWS